ncbi:unnamed protein product [Dibothriocephalus latus]|uniref:Uncharacterized protein n=1 Tax=Dibothriocephalus latus TaxID=60516 RepID=A0A3P6QQU4_DIBLA|nr:unnamed protein product [Dibothriocephalus latus]
MGGWRMEVIKVGLYLAIPLGVLTMSNMPQYLERNHEAQRLSVYEQTGVDMSPGDPETLDELRAKFDKMPKICNLHRINRSAATKKAASEAQSH